MKTFIKFLFDHPFFTACFFFSSIPFWVPILAYFVFGADGWLMAGVSLLSILAKAYIDSEITSHSTFDMMFRYFITVPSASILKFVFMISLTAAGVVYGAKGEPVDCGIAAVVLIYFFNALYLRKKPDRYWNISGLKIYRFYFFTGRILSFTLWVMFFAAGADLYQSAGFALSALAVSMLTFYKTNEGLL